MMDVKSIAALDKEVFFNTFGHRQMVAFDHGEGCTLVDTDGKKYTDFFAGIAVNSLGYGYPSFQKAMHAQLDTAYKLLKAGETEGIIICSNCIADIGLRACDIMKAWMDEHGDEEI